MYFNSKHLINVFLKLDNLSNSYLLRLVLLFIIFLIEMKKCFYWKMAHLLTAHKETLLILLVSYYIGLSMIRGSRTMVAIHFKTLWEFPVRDCTTELSDSE